MARLGEIVPRAGEGADYGASAALQRQQAAVPAPAPAGGPPSPVGQPEPGPQGVPTVGEAQDLNEGYDPSLFGPTDRTHEPITSGASFGPGAQFVPQRQESDRDFLARVAGSLEQAPGATNQVKAFAAAVKSGR